MVNSNKQKKSDKITNEAIRMVAPNSICEILVLSNYQWPNTLKKLQYQIT